MTMPPEPIGPFHDSPDPYLADPACSMGGAFLSGDTLPAVRARWQLASLARLPSDGTIAVSGKDAGEFLVPLHMAGHRVIAWVEDDLQAEDLTRRWLLAGQPNDALRLERPQSGQLPADDGTIAAIVHSDMTPACTGPGSLLELTREWRRVLRPRGALWIRWAGGRSLLEGLNPQEATRKPATGRRMLHALQSAGINPMWLHRFGVLPLLPQGPDRMHREASGWNQALSHALARSTGHAPTGTALPLDGLLGEGPAGEYAREWVFFGHTPELHDGRDAASAAAWQALRPKWRWQPGSGESTRRRQRGAAVERAQGGDRQGAVELLLEMIREDPRDLATVFALWDCHPDENSAHYIDRREAVLCRGDATTGAAMLRRCQSSPTTRKAVADRVPPVTVVVPVTGPEFCAEGSLQQTLTALESQDLQDMAIRVSVGASGQDEVRELIESFGHPRVELVTSGARGLTSIIRRGFLHSEASPLRGWMLPGDVPGKHCMGQLRAALQQDSDAAWAVAGPLNACDPTLRGCLPRDPAPKGFLYRREAAQAVGDLDPTRRYASGWDLWLRMLLRYPAVQVPLAACTRTRPHTAGHTDPIAAVATVHNLMRQLGGPPGLDILYPALVRLQDWRAEADAALDFATQLLANPWWPPQIAIHYLRRAIQLVPDHIHATLHLAIAHARIGDLVMALDYAQRVAEAPHSGVTRIVGDLVRCCTGELEPSHVPLLGVDRLRIAALVAEKRRIWPDANQSNRPGNAELLAAGSNAPTIVAGGV